MKNKILSLLILLAAINATASTNSVVATNRSVMVGTNGVLLAPTNFFAANQAALNAAVTGGGGSSSNLVPASAVYDNGTGPMGFTAYQLPVLPTNQTYFVHYSDSGGNGYIGYYQTATNSGSGNQPLGATFMAQLSPSGGNAGDSDGVFSVQFDPTLTNVIIQPLYIIRADNPAAGTPVTTQIYAITTNVQVANYGGTFNGILNSNTVVPDTALSQNVMFKQKPLNALAGQYDNANIVSSSNTTSGSTLSLLRYSGAGFSDINFFVGGNGSLNSAQLMFAIGCGVAGINQWPYNSPYLELFGNHDFTWVQYGQGIFGKINGITGDLQWFGNNNATNGSGTNTVFFETVRSNMSVVIGGPTGGFAVIRSSSNAPAASFLGSASSVGLWVSNGVLYARSSTNGTGYVDKQIAP